VPFVPDVAASLTLFDRPGRGFAAQWWKVEDAAAAAELIVRQSLAGGWRERRGPQLPELPALAAIRLTVLERGGVTRVLLTVPLKELGLVALTERRESEPHANAVPPAGPMDASA
jgi:hypothetical protein